MKAFLMYRNRDFDAQARPTVNKRALVQDLELGTLFNAMALGDGFLLDVAGKAVLFGVDTVDTILYRQAILNDCLKNPTVVREIYTIAVDAIQGEKKAYWGGSIGRYPDTILSRGIAVLDFFVGMLKRLRTVVDAHAGEFDSEGFTTLFALLQTEVSDEYLAIVQSYLTELRFRDGVLISAELGQGLKGADYTLRKPNRKQGWRERIFGDSRPGYTIYIDERDDNGAKAQSELRNRGITLAANALAQSTDHILSFFTLLRIELAFYIGCLNLHEQLAQLGEPVCFPIPMEPGERRHSFKGLYDVSLLLTMRHEVVGNNVDADNKDLVIITGANQGGKSTFLRSIGLAQLMMQCGMFAPAEFFRANICDGLFTHYKREEDVTMQSGKLDEELGRMSAIVDNLKPNSLVLFNESFAATNEREGSEIAKQVVSGLLDKGIKVFFVTHLYEFARGFYDMHMATAIFLRAERQADGARTFRLSEGEPLQTSYGRDIYDRIFGVDNTAVEKPSMIL